MVTRQSFDKSIDGSLRIRELLFPLLRKHAACPALEARNAPFLPQFSHTMPTLLCILTMPVVAFPRFSSGIGCLSLLLMSTSIAILSHCHSILFCRLLGPALASQYAPESEQAVKGSVEKLHDGCIGNRRGAPLSARSPSFSHLLPLGGQRSVKLKTSSSTRQGHTYLPENHATLQLLLGHADSLC